MEIAPLRFIGRISYGLYIWQQLFLGGPGPQLAVPLALAAIAACAFISYKLVEHPCIRIGRKLIGTQADNYSVVT